MKPRLKTIPVSLLPWGFSPYTTKLPPLENHHPLLPRQLLHISLLPSRNCLYREATDFNPTAMLPLTELHVGKSLHNLLLWLSAFSR